MAHLYRLVAALLALCCAASAAAVTCASLDSTLNSQITQWISDMNAARAACLVTYSGDPYNCGAKDPGGEIQSQGSGLTTQHRTRTWRTSSPATGSALQEFFGSWTACDPTAADAECKAVADALNFIRAPLVHYGPVGLTACYAGYVIAGSGGAAGGGQSELYGPFKCSGTAGTSCSAIPKPSSIVVTCKEGEYPGMVNGVQVCVPPSSSVEAPKTTTATPPTPGASAPPIQGAPQGTASQTQQTNCTGVVCTTTTIYKDASGNGLGMRTDETPKPGYCAENPKAPGCEGDKSTFGGDCTSGFTFNGDAIQGAIAQEVYRQNCLMNKETDEAALYNAEKVKTGDQTGTLPGNETVSVGPADFDSSDAIGGAACITDKTVTVWGKSIVLPFSVVCPAMVYLKYILLAVSYLTAAGIVMGRRS